MFDDQSARRRSDSTIGRSANVPVSARCPVISVAAPAFVGGITPINSFVNEHLIVCLFLISTEVGGKKQQISKYELCYQNTK